jgi:hypothetical protein
MSSTLKTKHVCDKVRISRTWNKINFYSTKYVCDKAVGKHFEFICLEIIIIVWDRKYKYLAL